MQPIRSWHQWYAKLSAILMLLLVMTGAAVTSSHQRPNLRSIHSIVAIGVSVCLLPVGLLRFGWIVLAGLVVEFLTPDFGASHALLAAALFAGTVAIAMSTSAVWQREPEFAQDYGWPSLRFLSALAAALVALQVALGAAMRHSLIGVMPHLLGALLVAIFVIIVGVFAMNQFPRHTTLRPLAIALLSITGIQLLLGMTAFLVRMMSATASPLWLLVSVAHVATGNLTLAFSLLMAMEIRRSVDRRQALGNVEVSDGPARGDQPDPQQQR